MDPTQATVRLLIVLTSRIQKSGAGDTNFSNEKAHFSLANQNDQTGHNGPPSMAVTNIPVGPVPNGSFHQVSNQILG